MLKFRLFSLSLCLLLPLFSYGKILNPDNPKNYQDFRMDYAEMIEIANPNRLSHRIFYNALSVGPDAKWFDAVK
ncbi:hypothetical protein RHO15_01280 [Utexia brackfieldae]|uniref:hypothetical protein n=1 Tax=Utexia brackfieldae TaxID=3074108 RepID=UPI00370D1767